MGSEPFRESTGDLGTLTAHKDQVLPGRRVQLSTGHSTGAPRRETPRVSTLAWPGRASGADGPRQTRNRRLGRAGKGHAKAWVLPHRRLLRMGRTAQPAAKGRAPRTTQHTAQSDPRRTRLPCGVCVESHMGRLDGRAQGTKGPSAAGNGGGVQTQAQKRPSPRPSPGSAGARTPHRPRPTSPTPPAFRQFRLHSAVAAEASFPASAPVAPVAPASPGAETPTPQPHLQGCHSVAPAARALYMPERVSKVSQTETPVSGDGGALSSRGRLGGSVSKAGSVCAERSAVGSDFRRLQLVI